MSADDSPANREEPTDLQFDRVETTHSGGASAATLGVSCVVCGKSVGAEYYTANGQPVCAACRDVVTAAATTPRSAGPIVLAGVFGLGAAIAGAAIYYAVIAIANLEIGIVAILIGYMVGWAVRKGAGGRGGRRFQILAIALTYWAVGLAYTPLVFKDTMKGKKDNVTSGLTSDSARSDSPTVGALIGDTAEVAAGADSAANAVPGDTPACVARARYHTGRTDWYAEATEPGSTPCLTSGRRRAGTDLIGSGNYQLVRRGHPPRLAHADEDDQRADQPERQRTEHRQNRQREYEHEQRADRLQRGGTAGGCIARHGVRG